MKKKVQEIEMKEQKVEKKEEKKKERKKRKKKNQKIKNNIILIRDELDVTKSKMAEILDVSIKTIENYENLKTQIPIDNALELAREYNYSLDYIYALNDKKARNEDYMIDIRELVHVDDEDNLIFELSNSHMEYLYRRSEIYHSSRKTKAEKENMIKRLDGKYFYEETGIVGIFKIEATKFINYFKFDNDRVIYARDILNPKLKDISDKQVAELNEALAIINSKFAEDKIGIEIKIGKK